MNFDQMYNTIFDTGERRITLAGRPGIGKTKVALQIAVKYAEQNQKKVLYITGKALDNSIGCSRAKLIPASVCDQIVVWEEIYRYCDDCHLVSKAISYCESHDDIGLVVFDDEGLFPINLSFVLHSMNMDVQTKERVITMFLANLGRKSERRRKCKPKRKDIFDPLVKFSSQVFAIYRENYYYFETNLNASNEYEFIRLK